MKALLAALPLLLAVPAQAQDARPEAPARTVTVTGTGEAYAAPDVATLRFSVVSRAEDASGALAANARAATAVRDRLRRAGVAARDMQTSGLSLGPYYDNSSSRSYDQSEIAGYEARNTLTVRLRDLEEAGSVIDAAVAAGANGLDGLSFGIEDQDALLAEARAAAVEDAREAAALLAEAAGATLGEVVTITEQGGGGGPQPMMMRAGIEMDASTPIEGGEQAVSANVRVVFGLE
jgi:uncharacterized protein YggE